MSFFHKNAFFNNLGQENGFTSRFLGFSVYLSNTTDKEDDMLCFNDTNYTADTTLGSSNITCLIYGRYVVYYIRTHFPLPPGYSDYSFNNPRGVQ